MIRKRGGFIILYLIIVAAVAVLAYGLPKALGVFDRTMQAEYGTLSETIEADCFVIRDETVYSAGSSGKAKYIQKEGEKIRKGTRVIKLDETGSSGDGSGEYDDLRELLGNTMKSTDDYKTKKTGILSFNADGYESKLNPAKISKLKLTDMKAVAGDPKLYKLDSDKITKGDPVFKICRNNFWYILVWAPQKDISVINEGGNVDVELSGGTVHTILESAKKEGENYKLVLRTNRYYKEFATVRHEVASVTTASYDGAVIDKSCITEKDGVTGVYVISKSKKEVFKPVQVLLTTEDKAVVTEGKYYDKKGQEVNTVRVYDEVIKTP